MTTWKECRFWKNEGVVSLEGTKEYGECHRHAPRPSYWFNEEGDPHGVYDFDNLDRPPALWANTREEDFCRDGEPR